MVLQLRLQNHGCRNHPYWWIVAAAKKKNLKGRFLEHIGYWIPQQRQVVNRSIVLNKYRVLYWLANGAQPTQRVQRCLSYMDLMPKPVVKHGSATIYDKPKKALTFNHFHHNPPFKTLLEKHNLDAALLAEDENLLKRELLMAQEAVIKKEYLHESEKTVETIDALEKEWQQLRAQLHQMEKDYKFFDPIKREHSLRRINEISQLWLKQRQANDFKVFRNHDTTVNKDNLKKLIVLENIVDKEEKSTQDKLTWFDELTSWSDEQVRDYLNKLPETESMKQSEKEDLFNEIISYAANIGEVISKSFIDDYLIERVEVDEKDDYEDSVISKRGIKNYFDRQLPRIPVHPIPDITQYDAEDYTDVLKQQNILTKNKAYSVPNIYLENDQAGSLRWRHLSQSSTKKVMRGRSRKNKSFFFKFSTSKPTELEMLRSLINFI